MFEEYTWISSSFLGKGGTVGSVVPDGFESIIRIYAPVAGSHDWWKRYKALFDEIFDVVIRFTSTPLECRFALWEGHGFGEVPSSEFPKLITFERSYNVFVSPLAEIQKFLYPEIQEWRNPDLIWSSDRSWFIGTDVDFWSLYVGGSREMTQLLIEEIMTDVLPVEYQTQIEIEN